jgi:cobalamin biosynthesis Co2+ chelatase CbiK
LKIIDAYIKVFEDPDDEKPSSDCLCKVITICQETFSQGSGEYATSEQYMVAYIFNPINGEVQDVKLKDIVINSYEDDKIKEPSHTLSPLRVEAEGTND